MKRLCIILLFFFVLLISSSCSRKSEIAAIDTTAIDLDSKSTEVVKTPANTLVFSVTEPKTFRELGLLTPESQSKYLKLSLNDFKEIPHSWSPEALLDVSVIVFVESIQAGAKAIEIILEMYVSFVSPPTEEQALKNLKDSEKEDDRQSYNTIVLLRRVMKAWGF